MFFIETMFHLQKNDIFVSSLCIKRVKGYKINRIVIAWLLSVVLLLPIVTKTIHIYQTKCCGESCAHADEQHSKHDCNSCSICQFTYYSFIEADFCHVGMASTESYCPLFIHYQEKEYRSFVPFGLLRAPPFV